jgi:hypothetical protein
MRKFILIAGLLVSMAFAFIALGQESQSSDKLESPKLKNKSLVYVYSYKHIKTLGRVAPPVYLDGKVLANLDGVRFFIVQLEPGNHTFHLKDKKRGGIEMEFKAGEIYYIRMDMREGTTVGPAGLAIMPRENGEFDIKQMKPIDEGDIKDHEKVIRKLKDAELQ